MKTSAKGMNVLRNDNQQNIVFKETEINDALALKNLGNKFFLAKKFIQAIKSYKDALSKTSDTNLIVIILSNTSQCYIDL